ncbi:MAG: hypothetical protein WA705_22410 [Candidatus Ozemobacteraceae bacterium]
MKEVYILGPWGQTARGRRLAESLSAEQISDFPTNSGICLISGKEFQAKTAEQQEALLAWTVRPGRALLLVPPFSTIESHVPVSWKIVQSDEIPTAQNQLEKLLLTETSSVIQGKLQTADTVGGALRGRQTALWRKHPHAGIFGVTVLPLWSLALLDHVEALKQWLENLIKIAGEEHQQAELLTPKKIISPDHFGVLLFILQGGFKSSAEARDKCQSSTMFHFEPRRFESFYQDLEGWGYIQDGALTPAGKTLLMESPYQAYAQAIEEGGLSSS